MTSSWFLLSTLNYDALSTTHQSYLVLSEVVILAISDVAVNGIWWYWPFPMTHLMVSVITVTEVQICGNTLIQNSCLLGWVCELLLDWVCELLLGWVCELLLGWVWVTDWLGVWVTARLGVWVTARLGLWVTARLGLWVTAWLGLWVTAWLVLWVTSYIARTRKEPDANPCTAKAVCTKLFFEQWLQRIESDVFPESFVLMTKRPEIRNKHKNLAAIRDGLFDERLVVFKR